MSDLFLRERVYREDCEQGNAQYTNKDQECVEQRLLPVFLMQSTALSIAATRTQLFRLLES